MASPFEQYGIGYQGYDPLADGAKDVNTADILQTPPTSEQKFQSGPFGWIDQKLQSARDFMGNLMPGRGPSPTQMAIGGLLEGAQTANRWLASPGDPGVLRDRDLAAPLGMGGMTAPFAKGTEGMLNAFVTPMQVQRLEAAGMRLPEEKGSLQGYERAQEAWRKGATSPDDIAEIWAKEGWAPGSAFNDQLPFSWLSTPDLRFKQHITDGHNQHLAKGNTVETTGPVSQMLEPNASSTALLTAEPSLGGLPGKLLTGPDQKFNGGVERQPLGPYLDSKVGGPTSVGGWGPQVGPAQEIFLRHELEGHALPIAGGQQRARVADFEPGSWPDVDDVAGVQKLLRGQELARAKIKAMQQADPVNYGSNPAYNDMWESMNLMGKLAENAEGRSRYFNLPQERMARHGHVLSRLEGEGKDPFDPRFAPGQKQVPWDDRGIVSREVFDTMGGHGFYGLPELMPGSASAPFTSIP